MAFVRFSALAKVTESGDGTTGWVYTGDGTGNHTDTFGAGASANFAASTDYEVTYVMVTEGGSAAGVDTDDTGKDPFSWLCGCHNSFTDWEFFSGSPDASIATANGDWLRFRRTGSTMVVDVSKDSGGSWTTLRTLTSFSTAQHWPKLAFEVGSLPIGPITIPDATVVTFSGPLELAAAVQSPAATSMQPVTMGGALAVAAAVQSPAVTYPVTLGGPVTADAAVQSPAALSVQPVTLGGPVTADAAVQSPAVAQLVQPSVAAALATPQQPVLGSTQPVTLAAALQLALTVQEPLVGSSAILVFEPAPIILAAPSPAFDDPYPHGFARRTRRDFRRAKLG